MEQFATSGQTIKFGASRKPYIVAAACKDNFSGEWICTTCNEILGNHYFKMAHLSSLRTGTHVMAWWCSGHGPEDGHAHEVKHEKQKRIHREAMRLASKTGLF
jgi:hypothetical protein